MDALTIVKFISLVVAVWFVTVVFINGLKGRFVSWVILLIMSASISLFVFLQWKLYLP